MNVIIDNASGAPIYEQIYEQIKREIISGALAEGEALPSIRALAKGLRISVITTKRAYEELERSGYIYTLSGKGSYVAKRNAELIREEYLKRIEEHLEAAAALAGSIGMSTKELTEIIYALEGEK